MRIIYLTEKHFEEIMNDKINGCPHDNGFVKDLSFRGCCLKCGPEIRKKCWEFAIERNNKLLEKKK